MRWVSRSGGVLAQLGADLCADVGLHELGGHPGHRLAQHVGVVVLERSLSASWAAVILALSAIVVSPFVALLEQTDDHEARGGRLLLKLGQPCGRATPPSATRPPLGLRIGGPRQEAAVDQSRTLTASEVLEAKQTGTLDLSQRDLARLPIEVTELRELRALSLSNNHIC